MPNNVAGDRDIMDDEYVAVLPGGFGNGMPSIGSNVYIIDWINGKVKLLNYKKHKDSQKFKIPHMGWNQIKLRWNDTFINISLKSIYPPY